MKPGTVNSIKLGTSAKPVLVTGATGFTGGALAIELRKRGISVRALVRDVERAKNLVSFGIEIVEGDVRDPKAVERAVSGCRLVYHIAALYRTAGHPDSLYYEVNAKGVENVLEAARRHGVERTVHCSTVGVHGNVTRIPSDESAPYNPGDIYQESKLAGEIIAQDAIASGQPVSIVRPTGIYGPGDLRFLKLFRTIQQGSFRMFGHGNIAFHMTYIDDMVEGIIRSGEHPAAVGEIFIIASNEYLTLNDLVSKIAEALGVNAPRGHIPMWPLLFAARLCELTCKPLGINPPLHARRCEFFTKARAFTNRKARLRLGFNPKVSLQEGLSQSIAWYCKQGLLRPRPVFAKN